MAHSSNSPRTVEDQTGANTTNSHVVASPFGNELILTQPGTASASPTSQPNPLTAVATQTSNDVATTILYVGDADNWSSSKAAQKTKDSLEASESYTIHIPSTEFQDTG